MVGPPLQKPLRQAEPVVRHILLRPAAPSSSSHSSIHYQVTTGMQWNPQNINKGEGRGNEAVHCDMTITSHSSPSPTLSPPPSLYLPPSTPLPLLPHVEVLDVDILVRSCLSLTPQQETFLCRHLCRERKRRRERGGEGRDIIFNMSQVKSLTAHRQWPGTCPRTDTPTTKQQLSMQSQAITSPPATLECSVCVSPRYLPRRCPGWRIGG